MSEDIDFEKMHRNTCMELTSLFVKKNHDYGNSFHEGFEEYGLVMSAVRIDDKYRRFKRLISSDSFVKNESIRDTLIDLANYAIMTVIELDIQSSMSLSSAGRVENGEMSRETIKAI